MSITLPQIRIPATYMRGGTSKGVFFRLQDLPASCQQPGEARDRLLLRVIGSPDPYGKQIDGMGGATSSTSKCVILSKSTRPNHDVDYLFGQVSIDAPFVDWSGNCGNLSTAVGAFALHAGLIDPERVPQDGVCVVRIWQANIGKTIIGHVPVRGGRSAGDRRLRARRRDLPGRRDRCWSSWSPPTKARRAARCFLPVTSSTNCDVPGLGRARSDADQLRHPDHLRQRRRHRPHRHRAAGGDQRRRCASRRVRIDPRRRRVAHGAHKTPEEAAKRQHTPKIAFVAPRGRLHGLQWQADPGRRHRCAGPRLSMGKLHHAMMGTASVAIATAAAIPGTLVNLAAGGGARQAVRFGHPSGTLRVGAQAQRVNGQWTVTKAVMSRSARILMEGFVRVPADSF